MTYQVRRLRVLLRCLLQPPMRRTNPPVTLVDEGEDVGLVFHLEARKDGAGGVGFTRRQELCLETFGVRLGASSKIHFLDADASVARSK